MNADMKADAVLAKLTADALTSAPKGEVSVSILNLAAAYLELRELARAAINYPQHISDKDALRAAIGAE